MGAEFQKTGRHPDLEQAAAAERVPALPERDQNRPHIFLDLQQNSQILGNGSIVCSYSLQLRLVAWVYRAFCLVS